MKKYDSYKDSGIEWIGEIPEGWEIKSQLRRCCLCVTPDSSGGISMLIPQLCRSCTTCDFGVQLLQSCDASGLLLPPVETGGYAQVTLTAL